MLQIFLKENTLVVVVVACKRYEFTLCSHLSIIFLQSLTLQKVKKMYDSNICYRQVTCSTFPKKNCFRRKFRQEWKMSKYNVAELWDLLMDSLVAPARSYPLLGFLNERQSKEVRYRCLVPVD